MVVVVVLEVLLLSGLWSPSVLVRPGLMLENMQISLLNISYPDQETGSAKHDPTRSRPMLCDKLDFICAESPVGAAREGWEGLLCSRSQSIIQFK